MVRPLKCFVLKKRSLLFPDSLREEFCVPEYSMACHRISRLVADVQMEEEEMLCESYSEDR